MTLEQATERLLSAAAAGDLAAIGEALDARTAALEELAVQLARETPSEQLARRILAAIRAGETAAGALRGLKQRIGSESARLKRVQSFVQNLSARPRPRLDCCG